MWGTPSPSDYIFFQTLPIKTDAPHGVAHHLKMKPLIWNPLPPLLLKTEAPFQEMIPRKNPEKSETIINTSASMIKQHWMADISQEQDFRTWAFKLLQEKWNSFLENITLLD